MARTSCSVVRARRSTATTSARVSISTQVHARDADTILGDNGNIYRLVGVNGTPGTGYLSFNYDNYGPLSIIPRAFDLLDYTLGGTAADIGGADLVHGESGDDVIHGMTRQRRALWRRARRRYLRRHGP